MKRASTGGKSQKQGAGRVFVVRIVLDDLCISTGFLNLCLADVAFHDTAKGMAAELIAACGELATDCVERLLQNVSLIV